MFKKGHTVLQTLDSEAGNNDLSSRPSGFALARMCQSEIQHAPALTHGTGFLCLECQRRPDATHKTDPARNRARETS